jgi:hypothetical protein
VSLSAYHLSFVATYELINKALGQHRIARRIDECHISGRRREMRAVELLLVLLLSVEPWRGGGGPAAARALSYTRADFPRDFVFGAGTSAYQVLHYCLFYSSG